jgi:hypothetical protein
MNTTEDRLRAAARAAAGTVADDSAPPLLLPRRAPRNWHRLRHPWIVAAAAAAAVIALISASVFAAGLVAPGARKPAPDSPARLPSGVPPYFVNTPVPYLLLVNDVYFAPDPGSSSVRALLRKAETLRIVATATGKVAATIKMPGYVTAVAASSENYFAALLKNGVTRFYEIHYVRPGVTTMILLPIPPDQEQVVTMAASPDSAKLAFSTAAAAQGGNPHNLVVASTTDGSEREWTTPARYSAGSVGPMAWLADNQTVAFNWSSSSALTPTEASLRLVDTAAPGSDLMAAKAVLPSVYQAHAFAPYTMLSPNGQEVVGAASGNRVSQAPMSSLVSFSTLTGKPTVLFRASPIGHRTDCYGLPLWMSSTGGDVLAVCSLKPKRMPRTGPPFPLDILLIDHGRATWLPWLAAVAGGDTAFP